MSSDVFISYTRIKDTKNTYFAVSNFTPHFQEELRQKSGNISLTVFQDTQCIREGARWEDAIGDAVRSARIFLILLSPTWLVSDWCKKEYDIFKREKTAKPEKVVIPLLWDEIAEESLQPDQKLLLEDIKQYQFVGTDQQKHYYIADAFRYANWDRPDPDRDRAVGQFAGRLAVYLR